MVRAMTLRNGIVASGMVGAVVLTACSGAVTSDQAELSNIAPWHMVPKSSPAQLVSAFDTHCVNGPTSLSEADKTLRKAGYVSLPARQRGVRAYMVDDKRPAVARSARMCMVQAEARTGQTDRVNRYVKRKLRGAQPIDPAPLGRSIEQAWRVSDAQLIATRRSVDVDRHIYALILYREGV